jgi:L-alanine-DL-glutamate epimerase-like enolase superfamily enzyme
MLLGGGSMRIREIRAAGLRKPVPEREEGSRSRQYRCIYTLVAIITDEGLTGLGSVYTNDGLVRSALAVLEPLYRGENALEPERVSEKLRQHTFCLGRGGTITHTISGIDIALWDLLGKATGQPIGRLLGGRYREKVRPYASLSMSNHASLPDKLRELRLWTRPLSEQREKLWVLICS